MGNETIRKQKEAIVQDIIGKLQESACTILTDYRGLNVADVTQLRRDLREAGVEYKVIKNTLTRRAVESANFTGLVEQLVGPIAIAFSRDDVVAPAKVLADFAKKHADLEIKAGIVEGQIVGVEKIKELADLPSREGLLSMLLSVLQAPIRNMALAVKAVADQQDGAAQEA